MMNNVETTLQQRWGISATINPNTPFNIIARDLGIELLHLKVKQKHLTTVRSILRDTAHLGYKPIVAIANGTNGTIVLGRGAVPQNLAQSLGLRVLDGVPSSKVQKRLRTLFGAGDINHATRDPNLPGQIQVAPDISLSIQYTDARLEADDGSAMIRRSAARKLLGNEETVQDLYALQIQNVGPAGVHKGYFIIHDDEVLPNDILFPKSAWRDDLISTHSFTRVRPIRVHPKNNLRPVPYNQADHLWHHLDAEEVAEVMVNTITEAEMVHYTKLLDHQIVQETIQTETQSNDRPDWAYSAPLQKRLGWITEAHAIHRALQSLNHSPWAINSVWPLLQSQAHNAYDSRRRQLDRHEMTEAPVVMISGLRLNISYWAHQNIEKPPAGYASIVYKQNVPVAICHTEEDNHALRAVLGGHDNDDYVDCIICIDTKNRYWLLESRIPKNPGRSALMRLTPQDAHRLIRNTGVHVYKLRTPKAQYPELQNTPHIMEPEPQIQDFRWDFDWQVNRMREIIETAAPIGSLSRFMAIVANSGFFNPARHKIEFSDWLDLSSKGDTNLEPLIEYLLDEICDHVAAGGSLDPVGLTDPKSWIYRAIAARYQTRHSRRLEDDLSLASPRHATVLHEACQQARNIFRTNQTRLQSLANGPATWMTQEISQDILQLAQRSLERRNTMWREYLSQAHDNSKSTPQAVEERIIQQYWTDTQKICDRPGTAIAAWQRVQTVTRQQRLRYHPDRQTYFQAGTAKPLAYLPKEAWEDYGTAGVALPSTMLEYHLTRRSCSLESGQSYRATYDGGHLTLTDQTGKTVARGAHPSKNLDGWLDGQLLRWIGNCPIPETNRNQGLVGVFELDPGQVNRLLVP